MKKFFYCLTIVVTLCSIFVFTGMTEKQSIVGSDNCYLIDFESGREIFAKGENEKRPIASMVKIMTLLLTFESVNRGEIAFDDRVCVSHNAAKQIGSEMFLDEGQEYLVSDLIKGVVTMSANDASVALSEHIATSEDLFVKLMNDRAKQLGMTNTLYANATGLPTKQEQYSTAKDATVVMRELAKNKEYYKYSTIWLEDFKHPSGRVTQLANTNKLIRHYKGCDAGKTGYTDSAKYCLAATAIRDKMRVVGAVLGAENSKERFRAMSTLFNYAFSNYKKQNLINCNKPLSFEVDISKGKKDKFKISAEKDVSILLSKSDEKPQLKYEINKNICAPIKKGDVVGKVKVMLANKVVESVNIVAYEEIKKATLWDLIQKVTK